MSVFDARYLLCEFAHRHLGQFFACLVEDYCFQCSSEVFGHVEYWSWQVWFLECWCWGWCFWSWDVWSFRVCSFGVGSFLSLHSLWSSIAHAFDRFRLVYWNSLSERAHDLFGCQFFDFLSEGCSCHVVDV